MEKEMFKAIIPMRFFAIGNMRFLKKSIMPTPIDMVYNVNENMLQEPQNDVFEYNNYNNYSYNNFYNNNNFYKNEVGINLDIVASLLTEVVANRLDFTKLIQRTRLEKELKSAGLNDVKLFYDAVYELKNNPQQFLQENNIATQSLSKTQISSTFSTMNEQQRFEEIRNLFIAKAGGVTNIFDETNSTNNQNVENTSDFVSTNNAQIINNITNLLINAFEQKSNFSSTLQYTEAESEAQIEKEIELEIAAENELKKIGFADVTMFYNTLNELNSVSFNTMNEQQRFEEIRNLFIAKASAVNNIFGKISSTNNKNVENISNFVSTNNAQVFDNLTRLLINNLEQKTSSAKDIEHEKTEIEVELEKIGISDTKLFYDISEQFEQSVSTTKSNQNVHTNVIANMDSKTNLQNETTVNRLLKFEEIRNFFKLKLDETFLSATQRDTIATHTVTKDVLLNNIVSTKMATSDITHTVKQGDAKADTVNFDSTELSYETKTSVTKTVTNEKHTKETINQNNESLEKPAINGVQAEKSTESEQALVTETVTKGTATLGKTPHESIDDKSIITKTVTPEAYLQDDDKAVPQQALQVAKVEYLENFEMPKPPDVDINYLIDAVGEENFAQMDSSTIEFIKKLIVEKKVFATSTTNTPQQKSATELKKSSPEKTTNIEQSTVKENLYKSVSQNGRKGKMSEKSVAKSALQENILPQANNIDLINLTSTISSANMENKISTILHENSKNIVNRTDENTLSSATEIEYLQTFEEEKTSQNEQLKQTITKETHSENTKIIRQQEGIVAGQKALAKKISAEKSFQEKLKINAKSQTKQDNMLIKNDKYNYAKIYKIAKHTAGNAIFNRETSPNSVLLIENSESLQNILAPQNVKNIEKTVTKNENITRLNYLFQAEQSQQNENILQKNRKIKQNTYTENVIKKNVNSQQTVEISPAQREKLSKEISGELSEKITKMVDTSMTGSIESITDKVYKNLENRLRFERIRRGSL